MHVIHVTNTNNVMYTHTHTHTEQVYREGGGQLLPKNIFSRISPIIKVGVFVYMTKFNVWAERLITDLFSFYIRLRIAAEKRYQKAIIVKFILHYQQKDSKASKCLKVQQSMGNTHFYTRLYKFCILDKTGFNLLSLTEDLLRKPQLQKSHIVSNNKVSSWQSCCCQWHLVVNYEF